MTEQLYLGDAYRKSAPGRVVAHTEEGGIVLDQTIFYARGGGQPGDSGTLDWPGGRIAIATAVKGEGGAIVLIPAEPAACRPWAPWSISGSTGTAASPTCASTPRCIFCRW
jgi:misacylated tRNA(Ala) deacylase